MELGTDDRRSHVVTIAAVCQAATIVITWPLWERRGAPPNLPAIDELARYDWGVVLLLLCALAVWKPKVGGVAFCLTAGAAMLGDQTRLQPEVVSLALLMTVPAYGRTGQAIARWHLGALWIWAGTHKALSLGWPDDGAAYIARSLHVSDARPVLAVAVPASEICLGLLSFVPRCWRIAAMGGLALHVLIFVTLSPPFAHANSAVWPWNLGLGVIALLLFRGGPTRAGAGDRLIPSAVAGAAGAVLVLTPALFYAGRIDAYLSYNVYSSNKATAWVCQDGEPSCVTAPFDTWDALDVPLPPEKRLYQQWFDLVCAPGTQLEVVGPRTRLTDPPSVRRHPCPATSGAGAGSGG